MSRIESQKKMGFYPTPVEHYPAILNVLNIPSGANVLDPCAGEGHFLEALANHFNANPYANELETDKAQICADKFGSNAVQGDIYALSAPQNSFDAIWCNPPYESDSTEKAADRRVEFAMLKQSHQWLSYGGIMMWCVYSHHVTSEASTWWNKNYSAVELYHLPGKHLGMYDQVVVIGRKERNYGKEESHGLLWKKESRCKENFSIVKGIKNRHASTSWFHPIITIESSTIEDNDLLSAMDVYGAHHKPVWNTLHQPTPGESPSLESITQPRAGHITVAMMTMATNSNLFIDSEQYGRIIVRSATKYIDEKTTSTNTVGRPIEKVTTRPKTILSWWDKKGVLHIADDDKKMLEFVAGHFNILYKEITKHITPIYNFDFAGHLPAMQNIVLKGNKNPLLVPQKHVVASIVEAFKKMNRVLLVGEAGIGKTVISATMLRIMWDKLPMHQRTGYTDTRPIVDRNGKVIRTETKHTPGKIMMVICPAHLREKWERELRDVLGEKAQIVYTDPDTTERSFQQVQNFIEAPNPTGEAKVVVVKINDTKLGSAFEPSIGIRRLKIHPNNDKKHIGGYCYCPSCGSKIPDLAHEDKMENCPKCFTPLWQLSDDPKMLDDQAQRYIPDLNPRYDKNGQYIPIVHRPARISVSDFIKKKYRHIIHVLVWDEVHEAKSPMTGNGLALARLAQCSDYSLMMTGTPFNGKVSSLIIMMHLLYKEIREEFPWGNAPRFNRKVWGSKEPQFRNKVDETKSKSIAIDNFVKRYGVLISTTPIEESSNGKYTHVYGATTSTREGAGVNPELVARLLKCAVFIGSADLHNIPPLTYVNIPIECEKPLQDWHNNKLQELKASSREYAKDKIYLSGSILWFNRFIDQPTLEYDFRYKNDTMWVYPAFYEEDYMTAKEQALQIGVNLKLSESPEVVVAIMVVNSNERDIRPRIANLFPDEKVFILNASVDPSKREALLSKAVKAGHRIIITNYELVKTGLDFIWSYPDGIYRYASSIFEYQVTYNAFTRIQASKRINRANSKHAGEVYSMFYTGTADEVANKLQQSKMKAIAFLLGQTGEGLVPINALSDGEESVQDIMNNMLMGKITSASNVDVSSVDDSHVKVLDKAMWQVNADWDYPPQAVTHTEPITPIVERVAPKPKRVKQTHVEAPVVAHDTHVQTHQLSLFGDMYGQNEAPRVSRNRRQPGLFASAPSGD
ncbi:MAG: DUF6094 domain-containing protein [bacterium]|nr:DUF6094 domain-containing protein [bacterium]